jgi:RNA polymerase sigma factor for flagellar operon FliA
LVLTTAAPTDTPESLGRFHGELDLVDIVARQVFRTVGKHVELDDLLSAGREGLLDAARRFDSARGVPFRAYANFRVRGAIIDAVRRMSTLPRRVYEQLAAFEAANAQSEGQSQLPSSAGELSPAEAEAELSEQIALLATACALGIATSGAAPSDRASATPAEESPEEQYERAELLSLVRQAIRELDVPREAEILQLHYFEGLTLDAIAQSLGMDKSWVSRLHARAMDRLAKRMRRAV